jgi:hypothetical protein
MTGNSFRSNVLPEMSAENELAPRSLADGAPHGCSGRARLGVSADSRDRQARQRPRCHRRIRSPAESGRHATSAVVITAPLVASTRPKSPGSLCFSPGRGWRKPPVATQAPWELHKPTHTPRPSVGQIGNPSGAEEVLSGHAGLAQPLCSTHSQREATVVTTRLFEEGTTLSSSSRLETSAYLDRKHRARLGAAREQVGIEIPRVSSPAETTFPQLSLSATVSIRLRATEIRRCQVPWRRPPQSPSRGCLQGFWPAAWRPPDGWRRRRGHHG